MKWIYIEFTAAVFKHGALLGFFFPFSPRSPRSPRSRRFK
jgi:hypothetical protein